MNAHSIFYYTRRPHKVGAIASEIVLVFNDVRFSFRLIKNSIIFFCICLLPLHDTLFDNNHVAYFCNEKKYIHVYTV